MSAISDDQLASQTRSLVLSLFIHSHSLSLIMTSRVFHNEIRSLFARNTHIIRDQKRREAVAADEVQRRAYLFVARNTSLPTPVRHRAQLALNAFNDGAGIPTKVKSRCIFTGRGRGELFLLVHDIC